MPCPRDLLRPLVGTGGREAANLGLAARTADLRLCRHPPPGRGLAELRAALHRPQRFARPPWVRGDAGHPATRGPGVLADRRVARRSPPGDPVSRPSDRSEEHTSELQSLMRISYAVFCLKKK